MAGTLYIVATPIGNLEDMPPRVAATFGAADFIAAEDTRVTMKLLNYLGLKKPMVSYYEHALQKGEAILQRIEAGESCALCSDAGMPCVSDPGEVIVRDALARGIKVVPIPAASACVTALAVSGQDTSRWVFEGFLPVNRKQKKERLAELLQEKRTVIFYEAPHKLRTTLDDLTAAFGADRSITLCRELTKLHEEIWKTTLGEAMEHYRANDPRGEYVLVLAGADHAAVEQAALVLAEIDLVHHLLDVTAIGADQVDDLLPVLLAAALENVAEGIQQHIVAGVAAVGLVTQEQGCPLLVGHSGGTGVRQHIHSQHAGGERKLIPVRSIQSALALFNGSLRKIAHHICAVLRHRHVQGIVLRILVHFVYLHNLAFFACFFGDTPVVEERASHFPLCAWRTVSFAWLPCFC